VPPFGRFEHLQIRGGELVLNPGPLTVRDVKFGTPLMTGKPSAATSELRPQIAEFFAYVREVHSGERGSRNLRKSRPRKIGGERTWTNSGGS
jgi:hypothetical protein